MIEIDRPLREEDEIEVDHQLNAVDAIEIAHHLNVVDEIGITALIAVKGVIEAEADHGIDTVKVVDGRIREEVADIPRLVHLPFLLQVLLRLPEIVEALEEGLAVCHLPLRHLHLPHQQVHVIQVVAEVNLLESWSKYLLKQKLFKKRPL